MFLAVSQEAKFFSRFIIKYEKRYKLISELNNIDENVQCEFKEAIQYMQQVLDSILPNNIATKSSNGLVS